MISNPPDTILRAPAVCSRIGLSRPTLWRLVRNHQFPKPFALTVGGHRLVEQRNRGMD
jgi:predicted DNA-binding transcriptional regulator AlpA